MISNKVLLVDDDADFSNSFKRLLESNFGVEDVDIASNDSEAKSKIKNSINGYSHIFVDCVLAGSDGVGLSKEIDSINKSMNANSKTFLMSGFVDISMLPDDLSHITKTLKKPIDNNELSNFFEKQSVIKKLDIFSKYNGIEELVANNNEKTLSSSIEFIPILSQLIHFEFSGKIVFMGKNESSSVIFMSNGEFDHITDGVIEPFGGYLERYGFINKRVLDRALDSEEFKNSKLRIGNYLVQKNIISPHAVDFVINKQTINRFKKILAFDDFKVHFIFEDIKIKNATLTYKDYYQCLTNHLNFENHVIYTLAKKVLSKSPEIFATSKLAMIKDENNKNLKDLDDTEKFLLIISGAATLKEQDSEGQSVSDADFSFIKKILSIENPYEVLGLNSENVTDTLVAKAYHKVAKRIHPDKLESLNLDGEQEDLIHKGFAKLTADFNKIKTADKRQNYETRKLLSVQKNKSRATELINECLDLLHKGQFAKASKINNEIESLGHLDDDIRQVYIKLWLKLKTNQIVDFNEAKDLLEGGAEKTAIESYLLALLFRATGDHRQFIQHLQQSTNIDASFLPARREFVQYKSDMKKAQESKKSTSTFGSFFSYKKSS